MFMSRNQIRVSDFLLLCTWLGLTDEVNAMTNPKDLNIKNAINENCPWSGNPIDEGSLTTHIGQVVGFCNTGCRDKFENAVDLFDELLPAS